ESEAGLCADSEDSDQLAEYMIALSNSSNKELERYSQNALNYFKDNFAKEKLLLELERILEK
ncbi:MAG: glycosyltransferase WbuB, partial [Flavobacteriaceae bacterium]|nr:glycosyltransferase WbuB [Flavobacteriaceae bacterium]